jgi:hypothetical protein
VTLRGGHAHATGQGYHASLARSAAFLRADAGQAETVAAMCPEMVGDWSLAGVLCQLPPAGDIRSHEAMSEKCHDRTNCTAANNVPIGKQDRRIIRDLSKENAYCRVASPDHRV